MHRRVEMELEFEKEKVFGQKNMGICKMLGIDQEFHLKYRDCIKIEPTDPEDEDLRNMTGTIVIDSKCDHIPSNHPYIDCTYQFSIALSNQYPFQVPTTFGLTDIYHMSFTMVDSSQNKDKKVKVCLSDNECLCHWHDWSPIYTMRTLLYAVLRLILQLPITQTDAWESPNDQVYKLWRNDRLKYNLNIVEQSNPTRTNEKQQQLIKYYQNLINTHQTFENLVKFYRKERNDNIMMLLQANKIEIPKPIIDVMLDYSDGMCNSEEHLNQVCCYFGVV